MTIPLSMTIVDGDLCVVANRTVHKLTLPVPLQCAIRCTAPEPGLQMVRWTDPATGHDVLVGILNHQTVGDHTRALDDLRRRRPWALSPEEQYYVRSPSSYLLYPQTKPLVCLYLDIEVGSGGSALFPKPDRSPVLMIGSAVNASPVAIMTVDPDGDPQNDRVLVQQWIDTIKREDPDLVVTYSGRKFDLPFLLRRAEKHGLDLSPLKRFAGTDDPLAGRVHVDLYFDGVAKDTHESLVGLPDRKMKTVARAYKVEVGEELADHEVRNILGLWSTPEGREKLTRYLASDVHITRSLAVRYVRDLTALAEYNQVPLSALVDTYKSFIPKLVHARHFHRLGLSTFGTNYEKYGQHGTVVALGASEDESERSLKYEGAVVGLERSGLFSPVWKVDVKSFYPSMFISLNLSPETTRIEATRPYTGITQFAKKEGRLYLSIPDKNFNKQIVISIDQTKEGFLKRELADAMQERLEMKAKVKTLTKGSREALILDAQQLARKILLNSTYGLTGQLSSEYGSLPCAIACVGMCRWVITQVKDWIASNLIEVDTDGVYLDQEPNVEVLNIRIKEAMASVLGHEGVVEMELETPWARGYFCKKKNYLLETDAGQITMHGGTFKNAMHCRGARRLMEAMARVVLHQASTEEQVAVIASVGNPHTWDFEDFVFSRRFKKRPSSYSSFSTIHSTLAEQILYVEKEPAAEDDQVEYVHTLEPWTILTGQVSKSTTRQAPTIRPLVKGREDIDLAYYEGQIDKILARFGTDRFRMQQYGLETALAIGDSP